MLVKKHLAMVCGLVLCLETWLPGVTFTVTDTADTGPKTLRQAIQLANTNPNPDTIVFNISGNGVKKISLLSPLFPVKYPVTIDGWSQGGAGYSGPPLIEIDGGALTEGTGCFEMLDVPDVQKVEDAVGINNFLALFTTSGQRLRQFVE